MATIIGTNSNNTLNGIVSADTIIGRAGNDQLAGAGGNDRLNGGIGNDTFDYNAVSDSPAGAAEMSSKTFVEAFTSKQTASICEISMRIAWWLVTKPLATSASMPLRQRANCGIAV